MGFYLNGHRNHFRHSQPKIRTLDLNRRRVRETGTSDQVQSVQLSRIRHNFFNISWQIIVSSPRCQRNI